MSEIIQTERDYVTALQFITDHYVPELQRDDVPQVLRGKGSVIFGNLEKIYQFHNQCFLAHLEMCESQPFLVGQYFLQYVSYSALQSYPSMVLTFKVYYFTNLAKNS